MSAPSIPQSSQVQEDNQLSNASPSRRNNLEILNPPPSETDETETETKTEFQFERLFSNLNQVTLQREPGSLSSAIFLVAGTTVGAGILAIPAVTQEAGLLASAFTCIICWL